MLNDICIIAIIAFDIAQINENNWFDPFELSFGLEAVWIFTKENYAQN